MFVDTGMIKIHITQWQSKYKQTKGHNIYKDKKRPIGQSVSSSCQQQKHPSIIQGNYISMFLNYFEIITKIL